MSFSCCIEVILPRTNRSGSTGSFLKKVRILAFGLEGSFEAEAGELFDITPFERGLGLGVVEVVFFAIVVVEVIFGVLRWQSKSR